MKVDNLSFLFTIALLALLGCKTVKPTIEHVPSIKEDAVAHVAKKDEDSNKNEPLVANEIADIQSINTLFVTKVHFDEKEQKNNKVRVKNDIIVVDTLDITSSSIIDDSPKFVIDTCRGQIKFVTDNVSDNNKSDNMATPGFKELLFGFYIPFGIFAFGLIINWIYEKLKIKKETEDFRDIIFSWINSSKKPLEDQLAKLKAFSEKIKESKDINPERYEYSAMIFYKLGEIHIDKYIQVFSIRSKNIEKDNPQNVDQVIYSLLSSVEFLVRVEAAIKEQYNDYQKAYILQIEQLNKYYFQLREITVNAIGKVTGKEENELLDISTSSIAKFIDGNLNSSGKNAKTIIYNDLITPIDNCLLKIPIEKRTDYINSVSSIITSYKALERQWDSNTVGYGSNFENYANSYNSSFDKVIASLKYLKENTKTKRWWLI